MAPKSNMTKRERAQLKERVERAFGGWGAHTRLATGLQIERSTLDRIYSGETKEVPAYIVAVLELLEALPPDQWPHRWSRRSLELSADELEALRELVDRGGSTTSSGNRNRIGLDRLLSAGYITDQSAGPGTVMYEITAAGRAALRDQ